MHWCIRSDIQGSWGGVPRRWDDYRLNKNTILWPDLTLLDWYHARFDSAYMPWCFWICLVVYSLQIFPLSLLGLLHLIPKTIVCTTCQLTSIKVYNSYNTTVGIPDIAVWRYCCYKSVNLQHILQIPAESLDWSQNFVQDSFHPLPPPPLEQQESQSPVQTQGCCWLQNDTLIGRNNGTIH